MADLFVMAVDGGPISQIVGFHVNPLYTSIAALIVGVALVYRLNSEVEPEPSPPHAAGHTAQG